ncbi:MAG: ATP-binding cassette domain-containing protein, partial [Anderseniella sp.]
RKARVAEQLKLVSLDQWADRYAHELSGGMQQRVGLARAFTTQAPILLMDEPFSALDPLIRTHLQDELLNLQRELKRTIIFVSHDLDEAMKIGNRIAIMEDGRIVQAGTPQEIVLNPANEYVEQFVQHMNPLNVMTGATIMKKLAKPKRVAAGKAAPVMMPPDATMREIIAECWRTGKNVLIGSDGKAIGEVGETEIYSALINRPSV